MKIMIESTDELTTIDGVRVRHWKGVTESGAECNVFVHLISAHTSQDVSQFERELAEQMPPGRHVPLSMIL